jgi:hypothetical protein
MKLNQKTFNQKTKGLKAIAVMVIAVVGSFLTAGSAKAVLSATGDFSISGGHLILTLTNTSQQDVNVPGEVLTAIFFNIAGNPALTPTSAVLNTGSTVFLDPDGQPVGGVVGGEWAFLQNLNPAQNPFGARYGVSSSGFGVFSGSTFPGPDLAAPDALNGANYGLVSAGYTTAGDNGSLTNSGGVIKNSVVFDLGAVSPDFLIGNIQNAQFQYGTAFGESSIPAPDGGMTVQLLGAAFVGLGMVRRFFFKH